MAVGACKKTNLQNAVKLIKVTICRFTVDKTFQQASDQGAKLITLPECFNSPYGTQYFGEYAENIPGNSSSTIADAAKGFLTALGKMTNMLFTLTSLKIGLAKRGRKREANNLLVS